MLGIDEVLAEIMLALGAALVVGMGWALFGPAVRERYGLAPPTASPKAPEGAGQRIEGTARVRAFFLLAVGLVMSVWALASILSG